MNTPCRIALLLPCLNEARALKKVIHDFKKEIPDLDVYVFDNGSTDGSVEIAERCDAQVVHVRPKGKGNVVRRMFEEVDADVYVLVDSDDTYHAPGIWPLLESLAAGEADMVVGTRLAEHSAHAFPRLHKFGNRLVLTLINFVFRSRLTDTLSGYRVMSKRFVKSIPFLRDGFEVETEMTVYSLICGFPIKEIPLPYRERGTDSHSKLNTFRDGYKVLLTLLWFVRDLRPLVFFGTLTLLCLPILFYSHGTSVDAFGFWAKLFVAVLCVGFSVTGLIMNSMNVKFAELQNLHRRTSVVREGESSIEKLRNFLASKKKKSDKRGTHERRDGKSYALQHQS